MKRITQIGKMLALVSVIGIFTSACTPKQTATAEVARKAPRTLQFVILQFNDVYEISPLDNGKVGGMARVATVKHQLEKTGMPVITVLDGDYLSPSLIGALKCNFSGKTEGVNGRHMVEVLNALGTDYVTFGNHEFDLKAPDLNARNNESRFRIISNNCRYVADKGVVRFNQGDQMVPDYLVHAIPGPGKDTLKLGLIGTTLEFTVQPYLQYLDPYAATQQAFDAVSKESDVVFGITHLSMEQDDTLARKVPGMPLIMGGHEHQNMTRQVGGTFIAKADANVKTLYLHWCTWDFDTKQMKIWSQLYPITEAIPADPAVDAIVKKWEGFANTCMSEQGYQPYDSIGFAFVPLDGTDAGMRTSQTNLGFLLCDAFKAADPTADLAIMNSGSVRIDDKISGFVIQKHILATLPFGGGLQHGKISGANLRKILDTGLDPNLNMSGAHLQYSSNLKKSSSGYFLNGALLDDAKAYTLTLPGFLAAGKENALNFIKDMAIVPNGWTDIPIGPSTGNGPVKNDVRDIVIWYMKQSGQMEAIRKMMK